MRSILVLAALFSVTFQFTLPKPKHVLPPLDFKSSEALCEVCEEAMFALTQYFNSGEGNIDEYANQLCLQYFGGLAGICEIVLDMELNNIIKKIEQQEAPAAICQQLQLCPSSKPLTV